MRKSRFSEEQIATALRQVESGAPVTQVSRRLGISEATFYLWKKQHAHLSTSELREVRQLREENARLKRLGARVRSLEEPAARLYASGFRGCINFVMYRPQVLAVEFIRRDQLLLIRYGDEVRLWHPPAWRLS
jgi:putative transposase